jgi:hypothetical protein
MKRGVLGAILAQRGQTSVTTKVIGDHFIDAAPLRATREFEVAKLAYASGRVPANHGKGRALQEPATDRVQPPCAKKNDALGDA